MKIRKILLAIFTSLAMMITMMPLSTVTVSADTTYDFTLYYNSKDEQLHKGNPEGSVFDEVPEKWEGKGSTLTLNGFNFTTSAATALVVPGDTTINLQNDNFIVSTVAVSEGNSIGVQTAPSGNLTFKGNGNLTASANKSNYDKTGGSYGISNHDKKIIFEGEGIIKATGGKAKEESIGILSNGGITVSSGIVEATGGEVSGKYHASYGIYAQDEGIKVSGGKLTATGGSADDKSYGAFASGSITVSGGKLIAIGGDAGTSYGVQQVDPSDESTDDEELMVFGGEIEATGGRAFDNSLGINTNTDITISGGKVTATGGDADGSYGLYQKNSSKKKNITVSGGEMNATSGDADARSCGLLIYGDMIVSKGKVIATSGDCTEPTEDSMQAIIPESDSIGIALGGENSADGLLIKDGGTVIAEAGIAEMSCGIYTMLFNFDSGTVKAKGDKDALMSIGIFGVDTRIDVGGNGSSDSVINIKNIGFTAQGETVALYSGNSERDPNTSENYAANIKDGIYTVGSTNYDGSKAKSYVKANNDSYKYVSTTTKKEPPTPSPQDSTNGNGSSDSAVDTGDNTNLALPIVIAIVALLAAAIITRKYSRLNNM